MAVGPDAGTVPGVRRVPVPSFLYTAGVLVAAAGVLALTRFVVWARVTGWSEASPWDCAAIVVGGAAATVTVSALLAALGRCLEIFEGRNRDR